jgi:nucleotide-binding universal stress UspA family protein
MASIKSILVATDFSHDANHALTVATDVARALSAKLILVHVVQAPSYEYLGGGVYMPSPDVLETIIGEANPWKPRDHHPTVGRGTGTGPHGRRHPRTSRPPASAPRFRRRAARPRRALPRDDGSQRSLSALARRKHRRAL